MSNLKQVCERTVEKSKLCKFLECQLKSMQKKLEYANLQLFGDRRWKLKPKMTDGGLEKVDSD